MKKILSLFLSIVMFLSITAGIDLSAYAAGNSIATATSISFNSNYSGSITATNTTDVYKFTLPSSGRINLTLTAYIYKMHYYIYNSDGETVWSNRYVYWNDNTKQSNITKELDLIEGTYYFTAERADGTGNYNFKITFTTASETFGETKNKTNNSIADANSISLGTSYKGQIAENDNTDIYKFTLPSSGRINLILTAYIYKMHYYIYDSDGETVWSNRYVYWNDNTKQSNIDENLDLTKGTYYFAAERADGTGNYNFKINFTTASETFSETKGGTNNSIADAKSITLGTTYKGQIAINDDCDIYKFKLSKACNINIKLTAGIYETDYYIYSSDGNSIWENRYVYWNDITKKATLNETLTLSAGTYYFSIAKRSGTGNYSFSINCAHNWSSTVTSKATTSKDGELTKKCKICGAITTATVSKIKSVSLSTTSYVYNGKAKKPIVTVKDSKGKKLVKGTDYTVKYSSNTKVGKATATITFKGKYKGTVKKTFTINPKSTSLKSVTSKKKKSIKVIWNKQATQTTGYEIQYSTNSKFTKNKKTVTVSKSKTTSKTISKLKANKKYYVRVRTYKTVNGNKYYSSWSKYKTVKTK